MRSDSIRSASTTDRRMAVRAGPDTEERKNRVV